MLGPPLGAELRHGDLLGSMGPQGFIGFRVLLGRMEKKMETTIMLGFYVENGKGNGNYYNIRFYRDNGKENGNYCNIGGLLG